MNSDLTTIDWLGIVLAVCNIVAYGLLRYHHSAARKEQIFHLRRLRHWRHRQHLILELLANGQTDKNV